MDDVTKKIKDKAKKDLTRLTDPIMDDVLKVENTQMPEEVFKGRYLDSFANGGTPEAIKEFASVAGGYRNEVDIVDSKGNVLYTTPPMIISPDFSEMDEMKATDLSDIGKETQMKMNTGQINPTKKLDNTLHSVEDKMIAVAGNANKKYQDKWKMIFNRYGVTEKQEINKQDDLEFDYDD